LHTDIFLDVNNRFTTSNNTSKTRSVTVVNITATEDPRWDIIRAGKINMLRMVNSFLGLRTIFAIINQVKNCKGSAKLCLLKNGFHNQPQHKLLKAAKKEAFTLKNALAKI